MEKIIYNDFCKSKECPNYVEWDFGFGDCVSCRLVGQSYNIDEYPEDCPFIDEIKSYPLIQTTL